MRHVDGRHLVDTIIHLKGVAAFSSNCLATEWISRRRPHSYSKGSNPHRYGGYWGHGRRVARRVWRSLLKLSLRVFADSDVTAIWMGPFWNSQVAVALGTRSLR